MYPRIIGIGIALGVACGAVLPAHAGECVVESDVGHSGVAGALHERLAQALRGECGEDVPALRERYMPWNVPETAYQVVRFTTSMSIRLDEILPPLAGANGVPLVVVANPDVQVTIFGDHYSDAHGLLLRGTSGLVVLDHLTLANFPHHAVTMESDQNVLIDLHVVGSGTEEPSAALTSSSRITPADPYAAPISAVLGSPTTAEQYGDAAIIVRGRNNKIITSDIGKNRGVGVMITEDGGMTNCENLAYRSGEKTRIDHSVLHDNGGDGIVINAFDADLHDNRIAGNAAAGASLLTRSVAVDCALRANQSVPPHAWHNAHLTHTQFANNGGATDDGFIVSEHPLPPPVDLIAIAPEGATEMVIVGNVSLPQESNPVWTNQVLDFHALHVELYLNHRGKSAQGAQYLATATNVDPITRQFLIHLPLPIMADGAAVTAPVLTAMTIDTDSKNSSPFARALDVNASRDWDTDGIPNAEEDANHDGIVDERETDPRLPDSDGDALTDGEEVRRIGHVAQIIQGTEGASGKLALHDLRGLDPRNSDSDGDCLPDGLELGITQAQPPQFSHTPGSVLRRPRLVLSPACKDRIVKAGVNILSNALAWDASQPVNLENATELFDTDPATLTDPTDPDSDHDGVNDGAEDANVNGARDVKPASAADSQAAMLGANATPQWTETDPALPDSDGDHVRDGDEGDKDGDGKLDENESDPLKSDTDGDGLPDDEEIRVGTLSNKCDSDGDGLGDGLEMGKINPDALMPECRGLQSAGSNFASVGALDPTKIDSDNDGLPDGVEDANHNGWLDPNESDPTTRDTDNDGISDAIEATGDLDGDGLSELQLSALSNGAGCSPPKNLNDVDCDGIPNARDDDSDNDGCSDRDEGIDATGDVNGMPAAYTAAVKRCVSAKGGGGSSSGGGGTTAGGGSANTAAPPAIDPNDAYWQEQSFKGGGGCALVL